MNRSFIQVTDERIEEMIQAVSVDQADGISIVCTNFPAVIKAEYYEKKYGFVIYDTITTLMWQCLRILGEDPSVVKGWGEIFNVKQSLTNN